MNKEQVKGNLDKAAGKAQRKLGEAIGSEKHQYEGAKKEVNGSKEKAKGNIKDTVNH